MKYKSGFTLVEILVVIVVISIIAGISVVAFTTQQRIARENSMEVTMVQFATALDRYYDENGNYPVTCDVGDNVILACSNLSSTYTSSMTQPPMITPSTTATDLKSTLPALTDSILHPGTTSDTVINQRTGVTIKKDSYFVLSADMVPGVGTTPSTTTIIMTFQANSGTLPCSFQLSNRNPSGNQDLRPHQYILGYFSMDDERWKFYISPKREDQNVLDWNKTSDPRCDAQPIGELKNASLS